MPYDVVLLQSLVNTIANTSGVTAVPLAALIVESPHFGWNGVFVMIAGLFGMVNAQTIITAASQKLFLFHFASSCRSLPHVVFDVPAICCRLCCSTSVGHGRIASLSNDSRGWDRRLMEYIDLTNVRECQTLVFEAKMISECF